MICRRYLSVLFLFILYLISAPDGWADDELSEWKQRATQITVDPELSDSMKVIRISDLCYLYFYYYRSFDERNLEDYFSMVEPFTKGSNKDDLLTYVYSTAIIMAKKDSLRQKLSHECIRYTEKCRSPYIAAQSRERLGRMFITDVAGLNHLFEGLKVIEGLSDYSAESSLYRYISFYYSNQGDKKNEMKYALLCLETALQSDNPRTILNAWETLGETHYFHNDYPAAIDAYQEARKVYIEKLEPEEKDPDLRLIDASDYMIIGVNLGSMYYYKGELDTASMLMNEALESATRIHMVETQAYCHKELGRIHLELKQYDTAEKHFLECRKLLQGDYVSTAESNYIEYEVELALANFYDITGDYRQSADLYKSGIEKYRLLHDEEQLAQNQQLAALYESMKQEEDIAQRETIVAYHERQKYLYACILAVILIALFFLVKIYRTRIRMIRRKEKMLQDKAEMLESEKRNTQLDSELKRKEADELREKLILGNYLREQNNKTLEQITAFFTQHPELNDYRQPVKNIILQQNRIDNNVDDFKLGMNGVPLDFYVRLQKTASNKLSPLDLKYCRLLYLETSTRDIADLLSVEPKTVRMQKYRLKQKLNLDKDDDLNVFIKQITANENGVV